MTNSTDRQGILDNLTAIETTAKLLVNAFVKKNNDLELSLNGIHREELITQTTTFLEQAQSLILNLSNTFNLTTDGLFQKSSKEKLTDSVISDASHYSDDEGMDSKSSPSKVSLSLSSVTLEEIIQNRLTPKHLYPHYPLLHDPIQPNLVSLARNLRQIENLDDLMLKAYTKIFNHEERICCNCDGTKGKLPYPRHKRLLLDLLLELTLKERHRTVGDAERLDLYSKCEKHYSKDASSTKYRGINIDHLDENNRSYDEKQFICTLFSLVIPQDDIKRILLAKQDLSCPWNDNDMCINYARPIHLLWIKQKWLERYPLNDDQSEALKWSQCIDWAMESFLEPNKVRPSKRKTKDISTDHKRSKSLLTFEDKYKQIDRTNFGVFEYATKFLQLIAEENKKNLPTMEQFQLLEQNILRFYWTSNEEKTWSQILDHISQVFTKEFNENARHSYGKQLLDSNPNEQIVIERLLQITF